MVRTVPSHPQEILENTVDCAHFRFVHRAHVMRPVAGAAIDGPNFEVSMSSDPTALIEPLRLTDAVELAGATFCHGPGLAGATLGAPGVGLPMLQRLYATPIDDERVELRGLVTVEVQGDPDAAEEWADLVAPAVIENWDSDIPIWAHKRYLPRPVLNSSERLIPVFRRWYAQFYGTDARLQPAPVGAVDGGSD
jgi:hypothetical protein